MIRLALVGLLGSAAVSAAPLATPTVDELLAHLARSSAGVQTLAGDFTQTSHIQLFKKELRSRGRLRFRRPRQICWEYLAPDPSTLILDGNRATLRMPGAAPQVFDLERDATMRAVFDQLLLWLRPDTLSQARADYRLDSTGSARAPTLTLTPKPTSPLARAFRTVELRLDGKSGVVTGLRLHENNGDEKEIVFTNLRRNAPLDDASFR